MGNRRIEDLTGQTFGLLTVIQRAESRNGRTRWLCRCACGGEKEVAARDLKAGRVKSCGCLRHNRSRQIIELTGQHFGRLTALEPTDRRDRRGNVYWRCGVSAEMRLRRQSMDWSVEIVKVAVV